MDFAKMKEIIENMLCDSTLNLKEFKKLSPKELIEKKESCVKILDIKYLERYNLQKTACTELEKQLEEITFKVHSKKCTVENNNKISNFVTLEMIKLKNQIKLLDECINENQETILKIKIVLEEKDFNWCNDLHDITSDINNELNKSFKLIFDMENITL